MAIVNISEAARLVGKSRRTIQRHIVAGKLSKVAGGDNIDTSELLRVYGAFKDDALSQGDAGVKDVSMTQSVAQNDTGVTHEKDIKIISLEAELEKVQAVLKEKENLIDAQKKHIESLDKAMLLLEHKEAKSPEEREKKSLWKTIFSK